MEILALYTCVRFRVRATLIGRLQIEISYYVMYACMAWQKVVILRIMFRVRKWFLDKALIQRLTT